MSSRQYNTIIEGIDQYFIDAKPAFESPEIALLESPTIGSEPDRAENHLDVVKTIAEVSSVPPEPISLMRPDEDEICIICGETSNRNCLREAVPCGHRFHQECILEVRNFLCRQRTTEWKSLTQ